MLSNQHHPGGIPAGHDNELDGTGGSETDSTLRVSLTGGSETDSTLEGSLTDGYEIASTGSTSVTSSIYAIFEFENDRRYPRLKNGRYPIPNDDEELNREDMKHTMMMELCDGQLFYAPIGKNPHKIIDVGTGTDEWTSLSTTSEWQLTLRHGRCLGDRGRRPVLQCPRPRHRPVSHPARVGATKCRLPRRRLRTGRLARPGQRPRPLPLHGHRAQGCPRRAKARIRVSLSFVAVARAAC